MLQQDKESPHVRRKPAPPLGMSRSTPFQGYFTVGQQTHCTFRVAWRAAGHPSGLS